MQKNKEWIYDNEGINYDELPEITDFSKFGKNPFAGQFKDGYTVIVEREDHEEVITISKSRRDMVIVQGSIANDKANFCL